MTGLMDAVAAATAGLPRLYPLGQVPASPTYPYGTYVATLGRADGYTLDSVHRQRWVRIVLQTFNQVDPNGALDLMQDATDALLDRILTFPGWSTTPVRMELDPPNPTRDPEDRGVLGTTATLTALATKET